jgi:MOSC domain-containing protein YiiM
MSHLPLRTRRYIEAVKIERLVLSPGHSYFGHHGQPAGEEPLLVVDEVECVAGRGLRGDRFFDHRPDYKGQITFFSLETYEELITAVGAVGPPPEVLRRNVFTRGVDLLGLVGREFEVQRVRFHGSEECKPCYWMDQAVAPGAEAWLRGRGGLRARILTDGVLRRGEAPFHVL